MNTKPNPRHDRLAATMLKAKLAAPASSAVRGVSMHQGTHLKQPGSHSALLKRLYGK